jgi:peptidoglycan hydrolase-like protein with peptidoglycan-binding domain
MPTGKLQIRTFIGSSYKPLPNAKVTITSASTNVTRQIPQNVVTDPSGLSNEVDLNAPPLQYSMAPTKNLPYSLYNVSVEAPGYKGLNVKGCQVYPNQLAIQECRLSPVGARQTTAENIDIAPNVLNGNYPKKIPESLVKVPKPGTSGFVVLAQVVVPELIIVHAGDPNDPSAPNYTIAYKDYIKNVASCEIYSTWPENTIRANVYCIISFTLNRIYTEWYRNQNKNFNITNSTAYDQAFNYGRNIYANISRIVDELFATFIKPVGAKQPLLSLYCDGTNVQCPGWLTQWGSKYLGDQGYTPYAILTHFYGYNIGLSTAPKVAGIPMSWPGYVLQVGSSGTPVRTIQTYLNRISNNYPAIPKVAVDGYYGPATKAAVAKFQSIFYQYPTGVVNYPTWYKISEIYVAVTKIAEL